MQQNMNKGARAVITKNPPRFGCEAQHKPQPERLRENKATQNQYRHAATPRDLRFKRFSRSHNSLGKLSIIRARNGRFETQNEYNDDRHFSQAARECKIADFVSES